MRVQCPLDARPAAPPHASARRRFIFPQLRAYISFKTSSLTLDYLEVCCLTCKCLEIFPLSLCR